MAALRPVAITGVGLMAPGLAGWSAGRAVLRGSLEYRNTPLPQLGSALLPAGERRRSSPLVRLALAAAEDAVIAMTAERRSMASVFASSGGDLGVVDRICRSLLMEDRPVSPTHFHNSVHNAAAGYWAIAADCRKPSVSLSAYADTFAAGLEEAVSMVHVEQAAVLLVAYDQPGPTPFQQHRLVTEAFAAALVLAPEEIEPRLAKLTLTFAPFPYSPPPLSDPGLELLRSANPAARCLPLLTALAGSDNRFVHLSEAVGSALHIDSLEEAF
jgi:hypothetical protein